MESGEGNAKRGCGRWMEECGRGAAVEQLTARGMEYQSPQWAIGWYVSLIGLYVISIPAMGAIEFCPCSRKTAILSIPAMGAIDQDYVGRFHYNRKRQLCQARPHLTCTNRTSLKERTCLIPNSSFLILKGAPGERAGEPPLPVGQEVYKENPVGFSALLMHRFILF